MPAWEVPCQRVPQDPQICRGAAVAPHLCTAFRSAFFLSESCSCKRQGCRTSRGSAAPRHRAKGLVGTHGCKEGMRCPTGPPTCMPLKRALMAVSSWLALLRTSSIMALRRTMASRVDVCSSFTACPGWRGGCGAAVASVPRPRAPRAHLPAPPGPASRSPARTPSRCRCSAPGSPCGGGCEGTAGVGDAGTGGRRDTHPCMSLKQLMQSMDFFSVENMM